MLYNKFHKTTTNKFFDVLLLYSIFREIKRRLNDENQKNINFIINYMHGFRIIHNDSMQQH